MTTTPSPRLLAIGTAVPTRTLDQRRAEEVIPALTGQSGRARALKAIYRRSGINSRGCAVLDDNGMFSFFENTGPRGPSTAERTRRYFKEAAPLAVAASRCALTNASLPPVTITHLITVSCTGFHAPGIEHELIRNLGLSPDVSRTNIGFMGCHAAVNAITIALSIAAADPAARVLLCCVEVSSVHLQFSDEPSMIVANALFADGAAAAVIAASDDRTRPIVRTTASTVIPDSHGEMGWVIGDHGFEMHLSGRVPGILAGAVPGWIDRVLATQAMARDDIQAWAIHPGGPRILENLASAFDLPASATEASAAVLAEHGNMSSATILFIIDRMLRSGSPRPLVAMAFGPGLSGEALVLTDDG